MRPAPGTVEAALRAVFGDQAIPEAVAAPLLEDQGEMWRAADEVDIAVWLRVFALLDEQQLTALGAHDANLQELVDIYRLSIEGATRKYEPVMGLPAEAWVAILRDLSERDLGHIAQLAPQLRNVINFERHRGDRHPEASMYTLASKSTAGILDVHEPAQFTDALTRATTPDSPARQLALHYTPTEEQLALLAQALETHDLHAVGLYHGATLPTVASGGVFVGDGGKIGEVTGYATVEIRAGGHVTTVNGGQKVTAQDNATITTVNGGNVTAHDHTAITTVTGGAVVHARDNTTIATVEGGTVHAWARTAITTVTGGNVSTHHHTAITTVTGGAVVHARDNTTITTITGGRLHVNDRVKVDVGLAAEELVFDNNNQHVLRSDGSLFITGPDDEPIPDMVLITLPEASNGFDHGGSGDDGVDSGRNP